MVSANALYRGADGWVMMFSGVMPAMNPPGDVTVSVSPTCSTTTGASVDQSR